MYLDEIVVKNYCSCVDVRISLSDFNPIIGYNNSGKSNILRSISWLLRKSVLSRHAFHDPTLPVLVEGLISSLALDLLPRNQQRQIAPYVLDGSLRVRRRQEAPDVPAPQVKLDVYDPGAATWVDNPVGLDVALSVLFPDPIYIKAMDDAADDIGRFAAKNTIGLLLKGTLEQIRQNNAVALAEVVQSLESIGVHLNGAARITELNELEGEATTAISAFFPGLTMHLDIKTPLFDDLIKGATVSLSDFPGAQRPFESFGHGAQRAVQMALIKLLASQLPARAADGPTTVLLIDEPELYLHPQAVEVLRDALKALSLQNFQIVFSTHSPLLLEDDVLNTSMVYKTAAGATIVRTKLSTAAQTIAANPHHASAIFSIQNATYLLFSETVMVVEGKTETMLLPKVFNVLEGRTLGQAKACIVGAGSSSAILPMMKVLSGVGFLPKALVDLDFIFKIAPSAQIVDVNDVDFVACHAWFAANQAAAGFELSDDGFPARKGANGAPAILSPAEAFNLMAVAMPNEVDRLVAKLKAHHIWVWNKGTIEAHIGIEKNDASRMQFITALEANRNIQHATHPQDLLDLIAWI